MLSFIVFTLATATNATDADNNQTDHIIFREKGTYIKTHATIHVVADLDFGYLRNHCDDLTRPTLNETVSAQDWSTYQALVRTISSACHEVDQMTVHPISVTHRYPRDIPETGKTTNKTTDTHNRVTRQLWAAVAAFTSIFGLYEAVQVHQLHESLKHIEDTQHHQNTILREQSNRLNIMRSYVGNLSADLAKILKVEANITSDINHGRWLRDRLANAREFSVYVSQISGGIQELHHGRLGTTILSRDMVKRTLAKLQKQARTMDGDLIIDHVDDFYRLPITLVSNEPFKIQVLIHVGVAKEKLRLLRYQPSPVVVRQGDRNVALEIIPRLSLLVHNENLHQEISDSDLDECQRYGNTYVCEGPAAFHTQLRRTCLGSLFIGDIPSVRDLCFTRQTNTSWHAEALPDNHLALYFRDPTSLQIVCPKKPRKNIVLSGSHKILLPSNCSVMGQDLRITSRVDVLLVAPLVSTPTWDPVVFLEGRTVREIHDIRAHLHSLDIPPADNIRLMLQQEDREVELRGEIDQSQRHRVIGYILFIIAATTLTGCLVRYVYLYFRAKSVRLL